MSLSHRVLGAPGQDNLLRVDVNAGTAIHRLQFDCGDRCLDALAPGEIKATEQLFFSHLHMDHVGGFDAFFRSNFERAGRPVTLWGPPGTAAILHHRFRGFWWNIVNDVPGTWIVHEVHAERVESWRFEAREAFASAHPLAPFEHGGTIVSAPDFTVEAIALSHHGVSLGYLVREAARSVIDRERLRASGLPSGPWLRELKASAQEAGARNAREAAEEGRAGAVRADGARAGGAEAGGDRVEWIEIDGKRYAASTLREDLLIESPRGSIAYLTDFLLDEATFERLVPRLAGIDTLVCESQYHPDDHRLAARNHHATIDRVAALAAASGVGTLVAFHLSERYERGVMSEMLSLARERFPRTRYPAHWDIT